MGRGERRVEPPEPPWVWGPSEIDAWIRGAYPTKRRSRGRRRLASPDIGRLRITLEDAAMEDVREVVVHALTASGFAPARIAPQQVAAEGRRTRAVARIRRALLHRTVSVSFRFEPPARRSVGGRILRVFQETFSVLRVSSRSTEKPRREAP